LVDRLASFFAHPSIKRLLALLFFILALVLLRHLALVLVFYLVFSRGLGFMADALARWSRLSERVWLLVLVVLLLGATAGTAYLGVHRSVPALVHLGETAQDRMDAFKDTDLYRMIEARHLDLEKYGDQVRHLSHSLLEGVRATGRALFHLVLGLILAVLYLVERREVTDLWKRVSPQSFLGHLIAFCGFTAEAILLTIKVQVIVALVNAAITLPILLVLRLPSIPTLMLLVFAFGLVPVVGNFLSGIVLGILSYLKAGWLGVGVFVASTVVLHKIESYYLNPRLTAKHVKLPSLMLVASLIIWEHLLGLAGVFISFPVLYVGLRIRDLFRPEAGTPAPLSPGDA
jgi:predicted PurR-regulated permease PerM